MSALEHYVVFRARPGHEADLDAACTDLADGLAAGLDGMESLSWGRNTNASGLQRGYTHGCLGRFSSNEGFQEYWNHPAHVAFMARLDAICEDRFAVDYDPGVGR